MAYKNVGELKGAFAEMQNRVAGNLGSGHSTDITNGEIIKMLEVENLIRKAAKAAGQTEWNSRYSNSNLSGFPGKDTIEKTEELIVALRQAGEDKLNTRGDFPLRNPKHVFDDVPENLIKPLLSKINEILFG